MAEGAISSQEIISSREQNDGKGSAKTYALCNEINGLS